MTQEGVDLPVIPGRRRADPAATSRRTARQAYGSGRVAYARDAFDGLGLMARSSMGGFDATWQERRARSVPGAGKSAGGSASRAKPAERPVDQRDAGCGAPSSRTASRCPSRRSGVRAGSGRVPSRRWLPYLNERMLFQFHWGYRKGPPSTSTWPGRRARSCADPGSTSWSTPSKRVIAAAQAVYGYWPGGQSEGDDDACCSTRGRRSREVARFALPRQARQNGSASPTSSATSTIPSRTCIGLQVVTIGQRASDVARAWFAADRYQDYLYLHGLGVEMAEALAEYVHKRIRAELGFAGTRTRATRRRSCCSRATGARATPSAIRPAPTWRIRSRSCWSLLGADDASACQMSEELPAPSRSSRPRPSSSTTPRPSTSASRNW